MHIYFSDLRYAWRRALRQPSVTLSIIALLALGMGGVTAVFNPVYSTTFAPLPFNQPDQLVRIGGGLLLFNWETSRFENEEVLDRIFSNVAAYRPYQALFRIPDINKQIEMNAQAVYGNFFEMLGVKPLIGYDCGHNEKENSFIVSHRFWRNELNQKNDGIGIPILLPNERHGSIIGIMPENFNFPSDTDVWECRSSGKFWGAPMPFVEVNFLGRMRPWVTPEQVVEELQSKFETATMVTSILPGTGPILQPLQIHLYGNQRPMLISLSVAAILFLTLVCVGVVNILIAQGVNRKQEIATRLINGATRRNLVFQLLREMLPLAIAGGFAGWWISEIASTWMLAQMPVLRGGGEVNVPVKITFLVTFMMVVTLVSGLIPALFATSLDLNTYLKSASGGRRRFFSSREFLVGIQLSVALALLIGVCVLLRSIMFNVDIPVGWSSRDIAVVSITHPGLGVVPRDEQIRYEWINQDIQRELRAMPEVVSVGLFSPIPFSVEAISNSRTRQSVATSRVAYQSFTPGNTATLVTVNSDGFEILGISLVAGRHFTDADAADHRLKDSERNGTGSGPAIINQVLAKLLWPEENNVIGNTFIYGNVLYEVVGVVRNFYETPAFKDFIPVIYVPYIGTGGRQKFLLKLRHDTSFHNFHATVRQRLSVFNLDWIETRPLNEYVKNATANQHLMLNLLVCFAVLGIVVSSLAVYATATLAATARTKETGIRMAIGAQIWDILKLAFWRGIRSTFLGLPFGLFLAWILTKVLSGLLFQVNIGDSFIWVISCAILLVISAVAALIPALRATRVNPLDALRSE